MMMRKPRLSVIVICYNMARELPRTIRSLSAPMQTDIDSDDYEIIIVDNGSTLPFNPDDCLCWGDNIRIHRIEDAPPSPVTAINLGIGMARGDLIGVCIDGARMASPGILSGVLNAAKLYHRPVVATLNFHLGPDLQKRSLLQGYNQTTEDLLLASVDWVSDGYLLFDISVFGGSSGNGWFGPISESNTLFLTKQHWAELGGYESGFIAPGGGLVSLDTWDRAVRSPESQVVILLGEGSFHQFHGGVATNAVTPNFRHKFREEYEQLRGKSFRPPDIEPVFLGRVRPQVLKSIAWSAQRRMEQIGLANAAGNSISG